MYRKYELSDMSLRVHFLSASTDIATSDLTFPLCVCIYHESPIHSSIFVFLNSTVHIHTHDHTSAVVFLAPYIRCLLEHKLFPKKLIMFMVIVHPLKHTALIHILSIHVLSSHSP